MKIRQSVLIVLLAGIGCASCASARLVLVEPKGGVVAIPSNLPMHRKRAEQLMAAACPGGYSIAREEEANIGTRVTGETTTERDTIFKETTTTQEYSVRNRTEWRITFSCR